MLIELKNITVTKDGKNILDDVSLNINKGEFLTIVGPNGAGKSTLLEVILGINKPTSGEINRHEKLRIGYSPQKISINSILPITVKRFLRLARKDCTLDTIIEETNIEYLLNTPLAAISGGELQRVLLARALLNKPNLLVLDEPAQNLDLNGQLAMYKLIDKIHKQRKCSILVVSHDLHLVMANTQKVICLYHHVCCSGEPEHITKDPEFTGIFGSELTNMVAMYQHHHDHSHEEEHNHD